jgi:hypothetical protein
MDTEIEKKLLEKFKIESVPMDGKILTFYNQDYTNIFGLFNNSGLLVYPVFTANIYNYGRALIVKDDLSNVVARYSSNGNLIVFNKDLLNKSIEIKKLNNEKLSFSLKYLMDFFVSIRLIKSYDKSIINKLNEMQEFTNITFAVSKNVESLMSEILGKKDSRKKVNCSKGLKIASTGAAEQFSIDFTGAFKINIQPYRDGIRYDFKLKNLNAYALVKNDSYENIDKVFKMITKDYLKKFKDVDFELDYIFTEDFFDYYKSLSLILDY